MKKSKIIFMMVIFCILINEVKPICNDWCLECQNKICKKCKQKTYLNKSKSCQQCPTGCSSCQEDQNGTIKCQVKMCGQNCLECDQKDTGICLQCKKGYIFQRGFCVKCEYPCLQCSQESMNFRSYFNLSKEISKIKNQYKNYLKNDSQLKKKQKKIPSPQIKQIEEDLIIMGKDGKYGDIQRPKKGQQMKDMGEDQIIQDFMKGKEMKGMGKEMKGMGQKGKYGNIQDFMKDEQMKGMGQDGNDEIIQDFMKGKQMKGMGKEMKGMGKQMKGKEMKDMGKQMKGMGQKGKNGSIQVPQVQDSQNMDQNEKYEIQNTHLTDLNPQTDSVSAAISNQTRTQWLEMIKQTQNSTDFQSPNLWLTLSMSKLKKKSDKKPINTKEQVMQEMKKEQIQIDSSSKEWFMYPVYSVSEEVSKILDEEYKKITKKRIQMQSIYSQQGNQSTIPQQQNLSNISNMTSLIPQIQQLDLNNMTHEQLMIQMDKIMMKKMNQSVKMIKQMSKMMHEQIKQNEMTRKQKISILSKLKSQNYLMEQNNNKIQIKDKKILLNNNKKFDQKSIEMLDYFYSYMIMKRLKIQLKLKMQNQNLTIQQLQEKLKQIIKEQQDKISTYKKDLTKIMETQMEQITQGKFKTMTQKELKQFINSLMELYHAMAMPQNLNLTTASKEQMIKEAMKMMQATAKHSSFDRIDAMDETMLRKRMQRHNHNIRNISQLTQQEIKQQLIKQKLNTLQMLNGNNLQFEKSTISLPVGTTLNNESMRIGKRMIINLFRKQKEIEYKKQLQSLTRQEIELKINQSLEVVKKTSLIDKEIQIEQDQQRQQLWQASTKELKDIITMKQMIDNKTKQQLIEQILNKSKEERKQKAKQKLQKLSKQELKKYRYELLPIQQYLDILEQKEINNLTQQELQQIFIKLQVQRFIILLQKDIRIDQSHFFLPDGQKLNEKYQAMLNQYLEKQLNFQLKSNLQDQFEKSNKTKQELLEELKNITKKDVKNITEMKQQMKKTLQEKMRIDNLENFNKMTQEQLKQFFRQRNRISQRMNFSKNTNLDNKTKQELESLATEMMSKTVELTVEQRLDSMTQQQMNNQMLKVNPNAKFVAMLKKMKIQNLTQQQIIHVMSNMQARTAMQWKNNSLQIDQNSVIMLSQNNVLSQQNLTKFKEFATLVFRYQMKREYSAKIMQQNKTQQQLDKELNQSASQRGDNTTNFEDKLKQQIKQNWKQEKSMYVALSDEELRKAILRQNKRIDIESSAEFVGQEQMNNPQFPFQEINGANMVQQEINGVNRPMMSIQVKPQLMPFTGKLTQTWYAFGLPKLSKDQIKKITAQQGQQQQKKTQSTTLIDLTNQQRQYQWFFIPLFKNSMPRSENMIGGGMEMFDGQMPGNMPEDIEVEEGQMPGEMMPKNIKVQEGQMPGEMMPKNIKVKKGQMPGEMMPKKVKVKEGQIPEENSKDKLMKNIQMVEGQMPEEMPKHQMMKDPEVMKNRKNMPDLIMLEGQMPDENSQSEIMDGKMKARRDREMKILHKMMKDGKIPSNVSRKNDYMHGYIAGQTDGMMKNMMMQDGYMHGTPKNMLMKDHYMDGYMDGFIAGMLKNIMIQDGQMYGMPEDMMKKDGQMDRMPENSMINDGVADGQMPEGQMTQKMLKEKLMENIKMTNGQMPEGQMMNGQMPEGQMPEGQMTQKMLKEKLMKGQMMNGQMPEGQMMNGQMPEGQMTQKMFKDRMMKKIKMMELKNKMKNPPTYRPMPKLQQQLSIPLYKVPNDWIVSLKNMSHKVIPIKDSNQSYLQPIGSIKNSAQMLSQINGEKARSVTLMDLQQLLQPQALLILPTSDEEMVIEDSEQPIDMKQSQNYSPQKQEELPFPFPQIEGGNQEIEDENQEKSSFSHETPQQIQQRINQQQIVQTDDENSGSEVGNQIYVTNMPMSQREWVFSQLTELFQKVSSKLSCKKCAQRFYYNKSNNLCQQCDEFCVNCNSNKCTQCKQGYYLNESSKCQKRCKDECMTCSKKQSQCMSCKRGFILKGSSCMKKSDCQKSCMKCDIDNPKICKQCDFGYSLTKGGRCIKCSSNCDTCNYKNISECTKCLVGFQMQKGNWCASCSDNCLYCQGLNCSKCAPGFQLTQKEEYLICQQSCTFPCKNCTAGKCTDCQNGFTLQQQMCVPEKICQKNCQICPMSYYKTQGEQCKMCSDKCLYCMKEQKCEECMDGYYVKDGKCHKCSVQCKKCVSASQCTVCSSGFVAQLHRFTNVSSLVVGSKCMACKTPCKTCSLSPQICTQCMNDKYILNGARCISQVNVEFSYLLDQNYTQFMQKGMLKEFQQNMAKSLNTSTSNIFIDEVKQGSTRIQGRVSSDPDDKRSPEDLMKTLQESSKGLGFKVLSSKIQTSENSIQGEQTESKSELNQTTMIGIIVGTLVGGLILIAASVLIYIKCYRKGARQEDENQTESYRKSSVVLSSGKQTDKRIEV